MDFESQSGFRGGWDRGRGFEKGIFHGDGASRGDRFVVLVSIV